MYNIVLEHRYCGCISSTTVNSIRELYKEYDKKTWIIVCVEEE
jgi:hypothetical protein